MTNYETALADHLYDMSEEELAAVSGMAAWLSRMSSASSTLGRWVRLLYAGVEGIRRTRCRAHIRVPLRRRPGTAMTPLRQQDPTNFERARGRTTSDGLKAVPPYDEKKVGTIDLAHL